MMFTSTIISALAVLPFAVAVTFEVTVGAGGNLAYNPPSISGAVEGDTVHFTFNPKNHTVTQSSFDVPCSPLAGGFTSGFMPVTATTTPLPVVSFVVPAGTAPLWFHCEQTGHCGKGMVFAINPPEPPSPKSFDAFKALATGGQSSTSDVTATSTASDSAETATSTSSSMSDDGDDDSDEDDGTSTDSSMSNSGDDSNDDDGMSSSSDAQTYCTQYCSQLYFGQYR
ncbi:hypothetical protein GALMADRAFT_162362 [Galerina marginata CBS 339.88]|uniref:Phytocyanin domain-containing protein n=1 Tax=Galerina marginata (strain CBS 339.88) TaxID=685588 RepID=A0A067S4U6_GALM3|nr:hypothetical protein GALMADRAFT_162362 [Galerina marginata CBS 339.88]